MTVSRQGQDWTDKDLAADSCADLHLCADRMSVAMSLTCRA
jgi:hypothetical protein